MGQNRPHLPGTLPSARGATTLQRRSRSRGESTLTEDIDRTDRPLVVSIITPSFNQAAYLPHTLESIANQTYPHIEHIVMDGGSTDGSVEIIRDWAEGHSIVWRSERDGG